MDYSFIESDLKVSYPQLESFILIKGNSSIRCFYLPEGFKDIGAALVFGYLEISKVEELDLLLNELEDIARLKEIDLLVGPLNFSTFFDYRAKLDSFDLPCFPGEPRNLEYLPNCLERHGFSCLKKYYSHEFSTRLNFKFHFSIIFMGLWGQIRTLFRYRAAFLNSENYIRYLPEIYEITMSTFANNFIFMGISYSAFKKYFETSILPYMDFQTSVMMFDEKNQLVGYSLCLKDPLNMQRLLFKTIGVVKNHRKGGFVALQIMRMVYLQARKNFHLCLACLMIEDNKIDRVFKSMSLQTTSYGLFQKKLNLGS